jgi:hypothetical protein
LFVVFLRTIGVGTWELNEQLQHAPKADRMRREEFEDGMDEGARLELP